MVVIIVALAAAVVMGFAIVFAAFSLAFAAFLLATFVFLTALVAVTAFFVAIIIATAASGHTTVGLHQFGDLAHGVLGEVELAHHRAADPSEILDLSQSAVVGVGMIGELRSWT